MSGSIHIIMLDVDYLYLLSIFILKILLVLCVGSLQFSHDCVNKLVLCRMTMKLKTNK